MHFVIQILTNITQLFLRLQPFLTSLDSFLPASNPPSSTPFTQTAESPMINHPLSSEFGLSDLSRPQGAHLHAVRQDRTALLLSSTSWTADEDFGMLIDALGIYERIANNENDGNGGRGGLPKVMMIVTGKGPLKRMYMDRIERLQKEWKWVKCISLWLDAADYPLLLGKSRWVVVGRNVNFAAAGSADLGICLHSSSSALDLPMKIVDMFGCGLPVCALDFAWLGIWSCSFPI
jgi:beta-1,4-mannosyltransferase